MNPLRGVRLSVVLGVVVLGLVLVLVRRHDEPPPLAGALEPDAVVAAMRAVADWQIDHPLHGRWGADWQSATFYAGLADLVETTGDRDRRAWLVERLDRLGWEPTSGLADDHAVSQTYLRFAGGDPARIAPTRESMDRILARIAEGRWPLDRPRPAFASERIGWWWWCDALHMAPPAWALMSRATGDGRYLDEALRQWWRTTEILFIEEEGLFVRDERYLPPGRRVYWCRGNGWVLAGLTRMLPWVPVDHPTRPRLVELLVRMAGRAVELQREDGLWPCDLRSADAQVDTSGSGLILFALAHAVAEGVLPAGDFQGAVETGWRGLVARVRPDGQLTGMQPVASAPGHYRENVTLPYGSGAFLMAGSQVLGLVEARSGGS